MMKCPKCGRSDLVRVNSTTEWSTEYRCENESCARVERHSFVFVVSDTHGVTFVSNNTATDCTGIFYNPEAA